MNTRRTLNALRRRSLGENGQSIITIALAAVFFVILLAVVGDVAQAWWQRRELQNSADAAALAAAQLLPDQGAATTEANVKVAANEEDVESTEVTFGDNVAGFGPTSVTVKVNKSTNSLFGSIGVGFDVTADATARIASPLLPGSGVVPLAIDESTYNGCLNSGGNSSACENVVLKENSQNNEGDPSSYQLLDLEGGSGGQGVCEYLIGGGEYDVRDPESQEPGNVSSLFNCLVERMAAATANGCLTYDQVTDDDGVLLDECNPLLGAERGSNPLFPDAQPTAVVLIPVVKDFCQGACQVDIVGDDEELRTFAFFLVDLTTIEEVDGYGPTCLNPGLDNGRASTAEDVWPAGDENGPVIFADHKPGHAPGGEPGEQPPGQCDITGQFLLEWKAFIAVNTGGNGEFDPDFALIKVIELVE